MDYPGGKVERSNYGVLVRNKTDYNYLRFSLEDNNEEFEMCKRWELHIASGDKISQHTAHIFSLSGGYFWPLLVGNVVCVVLIICFGFAYEIFRVRHTKKKKTVEMNGTTDSAAHNHAYSFTSNAAETFERSDQQ